MTSKLLADALWLKSPASQAVFSALAKRGFAARFAGGCVRDGLLDRNLVDPDLDIATAAKPDDVMAMAKAERWRCLPTGIAHGTVTLLIDRQSFEVTTLRLDVDTDGRHAEVAFTNDFEADAARRDLTINAMSCDIGGQVFDYFGGLEDLSAGRIRFVGDPMIRLAEDYLRILRYFRFFARFGRGDDDRATLEAIEFAIPGLERISGERIQKELRGLLVAPGAWMAAQLMVQTGVATALFGTAGNIERLARSVTGEDWLIRLAIWLHGYHEAETVTARLKLSVVDREDFIFWLNSDLTSGCLSSDARKRLLYRYGRRRATGLLALSHAEFGQFDFAQALALLTAEPMPKMPLRGRDLLELGLIPGPALGSLLQSIEEAWLLSGCKLTAHECLELARQEISK